MTKKPNPPKIPKETGEEVLHALEQAVEADESVSEYFERLRRVFQGDPADTIGMRPAKDEEKGGLDPDEPIEDHASYFRRVIRRMMRD